MPAAVVADLAPHPGVLFGCDYNPEQWDRATWIEDMALMREAGIGLVAINIFGWSSINPAPGVWNPTSARRPATPRIAPRPLSPPTRIPRMQFTPPVASPRPCPSRQPPLHRRPRTPPLPNRRAAVPRCASPRRCSAAARRRW